MSLPKAALVDIQRSHKPRTQRTTSEYDLYEIAPANMRLRFFLLTDLLALLAAPAMAALLAAHINFYYFKRPLLDPSALPAGLAAVCVLIATGLLFWFAHRQHYAQRLPYWLEVREIILGAGICSLLHSSFLFLNHASFSRLWLFSSWLFAALFIALGRHALRQALKRTGRWSVDALYIGNTQSTAPKQSTVPTCREMGFHIRTNADEDVITARLLAGESWSNILDSYGVEAVLIYPQSILKDTCDLWLMQLRRQKIPCSIVHHDKTFRAMILGQWLPRLGKRMFDLTVSAVALVALAPVFIVLALLIKRDGGPVFHADTRVGIDGKLMQCLKFRSMLINADQELVRYLRSNPAAAAEWARYQKLRRDPRITTIGRFIRKTSLDELPQLINVFWGEMTLVGPRPIIPNQKQAYGPNISYYHAVRPGITGLWQVSGRNRLTFRQRAKLDRWYVRHWSLWLDIVILFRTFPVLLLRRDAY
ncbi:MAG: sugar transferase [Alphaproteobacteria bacterium]